MCTENTGPSEEGRAVVESDSKYFAQEGGSEPAGEGSFFRWSEQEPIEVTPGLRFQPILGTNLMANFVAFEPNTEAPLHWHDEEQISLVIEGEFEFEVGGKKQICKRGDAVLIPPNVPHAARTYDSTCLEIDIFNPPRQGLLDLMALKNEGA
jgi:quercetin dioxygenase-like cupin family protein